jgi:predicted nucleotidyltransferase
VVAAHYTEAEAETIRSFVRARKRERERSRAELLAAAQKDCASIVSLIARELDPARIHLWGSLVNTAHFSENSDIDIAVEGAADPERLFELAGRAQGMTGFDLDVVRLEAVHPAYADHIRRRGRVVYDRQAKS